MLQGLINFKVFSWDQRYGIQLQRYPEPYISLFRENNNSTLCIFYLIFYNILILYRVFLFIHFILWTSYLLLQSAVIVSTRKNNKNTPTRVYIKNYLSLKEHSHNLKFALKRIFKFAFKHEFKLNPNSNLNWKRFRS